MKNSTVKKIRAINGKEIEILWKERGKIDAYILDSEGKKVKQIKSEYLPKEVSILNNSLTFTKFFQSVSVNTVTLSNGDEKLNIYGRLKGGALTKNNLNKLNATLKRYDKLSNKKKAEVISLVKSEIMEQREIFSKKIEQAECDLSQLNLIVGATRSGKSTLFNFLNGYPLISKKEAGKNLVLDVDIDQLTPKQLQKYSPIGHGYTSETTVPNFAKSPSSDAVYVDCAGEFDSKDILQSIINAYFKVDLTNKAREVKLTLVIPASNLTPAGSGYFRQILKEIGKFIGDWNSFRESKSISLIVSHADLQTSQSDFLQEILNIIRQVDDLGEFKEILQDIYDRQALEIFYKPESNESLKLSQMNAAKTLLEAGVTIDVIKLACPLLSEQELNTGELEISNAYAYTPPRTANELSLRLDQTSEFLIKKEGSELFNVNIPSNVQEVIDLIAQDLEKSLIIETNNIAEKLISQRIINELFDTGLEKFDYYIEQCNKSNSFTDILENLKIDSNNRLKNLNEDLLNFAKIGKTNLNIVPILKLHIENSILLLKKSYNELPTEIENIDNTLEIKGFNINLSEINKYDIKDIKNIRIIALNKLLVDASLEQNIMAGKNLTIIANRWVVDKDRKINLSGKDIEDIPNKAIGNQDGNPGKVGNNGGNFFGYGNYFENIGKLEIISNGGKGGKGQDGGKGLKGADGNDATRVGDGIFQKREEYYYMDTILVNEHRDHYVFKNNTAGSKGGKGYAGGAGGKGGLAGNIELLGTYKVLQQQVEGDDGDKGLGGEGGDGGKNGREAVYYYNKIKPTGLTVVTTLGTCYAGTEKMSGWGGIGYYIPDIASIANKGDKGIDGDNSSGLIRPRPNDLVDVSKEINLAKHYAREKIVSTKEFDKITNKFIHSLDNNEEILEKTSVSSLFKELILLEKINHKYGENNIEIIPHYELLQYRIFQYANKCNDDEEIKALNYLYTKTLSSVLNLKELKHPNVIVDILGYLKIVKKNISEFEKQGKSSTIKFYQNEYNSNIKNKISEAESHILVLGTEINTIQNGFSKNISDLLAEIKLLEKNVVDNGFALKAKKLELEKLLPLKVMFGVLNMSCQVLSCCGPEAALIGGVIGVAGGVAQSIACKESGTPGALKIPGAIASSFKEVYKYKGSKLNEKYKKMDNSFKLRKDIESISNLEKDNDYSQNLFAAEASFTKHTYEYQKEELIEQNKQYKKTKGRDLENFDIKKQELNNLEQNRLALLEANHEHALEIRRQEKASYTDEKKYEKAQKQIQEQKEELAKRIKQVETVVNVAETSIDLYNTYTNDSEKIEQLEKAIEANAKQLKQIGEFEKTVQSFYEKELNQMRHYIENFQHELKGQSHVALDVSKWNIQKTLGHIKQFTIDITKELKVEGQLADTIQKVIDAINLVINIYDRIQDFQDQTVLANYIANIESSSSKISVKNNKLQEYIDNLDITISHNLILNQYIKTINAFKQWVFPFANKYMQEFDLLPNFEENCEIGDVVNELCNRIRKITEKINNNFSSIVEADQLIHSNVEFYDKKSTEPFYKWYGRNYQISFDNLFKGEEIILNSRISKDSKSAVKFTEIGLEFSSQKPILQEQLDYTLKFYNIKLTQNGPSYYKFENNVYSLGNTKLNIQYSYEKDQFGDRPANSNNVYKKLSEGNAMISPYGAWIVQLMKCKNDSPEFEFSSEDIKNIEIKLVGKGYYVDEENNELLQDLKLTEYYQKEVDYCLDDNFDEIEYNINALGEVYDQNQII